jgi:hypothetical protein
MAAAQDPRFAGLRSFAASVHLIGMTPGSGAGSMMRRQPRRIVMGGESVDHHTAYLTRAVAALTPQGHERVDELLEQLAQSVGSREDLIRFAKVREAEADLGRTDPRADAAPLRTLTKHELDVLATGFITIRDQEPLDDVADWANAVVALIEDEAARRRPY